MSHLTRCWVEDDDVEEEPEEVEAGAGTGPGVAPPIVATV